jgi:MFS family permease
MDLQKAMNRNIKLLALNRASRMFMISMATIVPYWTSLGLTQANIYQLQVVFLLTVVALEVPSGHFADTYGRRKSIVFGQLVSGLAWIGYAFADSFTLLMIVEFLLGVGMSFISGADSALRYDSLIALNRSCEGLRSDSRSEAYAAWAEGIAGLIGGAFVLISLQAPLYAQAVWSLISMPIVFGLREAPIHQSESTTHPWRGVMDVTRFSLHGHPQIKWLILYSSMLGSLTYTMVWLMQPYYTQSGVPLGLFGLLWFIKHLFLGGFMYTAANFRQRLGLGRGLLLLPIVGVICYVLLGLHVAAWVLPVMIGFELIRGVQNPLIRDEINQYVPSSIRATVLSVQGFAARLAFAVFGLLIGFITDLTSLRGTLLFSAVIYGSVCGIVVTAMVKRKLITL